MVHINAKSQSEAIIMTLESLVLNKSIIIRQCYNGASVTSGQVNGVQTLIRQVHGSAMYIHCHAHRLNVIMCEPLSKMVLFIIPEDTATGKGLNQVIRQDKGQGSHTEHHQHSNAYKSDSASDTEDFLSLQHLLYLTADSSSSLTVGSSAGVTTSSQQTDQIAAIIPMCTKAVPKTSRLATKMQKKIQEKSCC